MKKIILTAVMTLSLLYIGLIDFSYAKDLVKDFSELTGSEMAKENTPIILVQEKSTVGNYEFQEPYDTEKVEKEEDEAEDEEEKVEEEDDENGAGVGLERRKDRRKKKALKGK